jgi:hemoglobin-like flavoprotein
MTLDAKLLRENFESLRPRGLEVMRDFYRILFERRPDVKPMFAHVNMDEQVQKIFDTLDVIVQNLEKPDVLLSHLLLLGNSHVDYGVKPAHYGPVLDSLIEAMKRASGPAWTPALESGWRQAYNAVAEIMQKGTAIRRKP